MSAIATAIIGGAVIGGVAQSNAAKKAAGAQGKAADAGIAEQRRQFDTVMELLNPYVEAATGKKAKAGEFNSEQYLKDNPDVAQVLNTGMWKGKPANDDWLGAEDPAYAHYLQYGQKEGRAKPVYAAEDEQRGTLDAQLDLLGINGSDRQSAAIKMIEGSPMFSGLVKQGEEAILQNASATGGLRGGNTQGALAQFRPQMLSALIDQQYNRLAGVTAAGQAAASGQAVAAQNTGNNVSSLLLDQGASQAGRYMAQGQAVSNVGNAITTAIIAKGGF